MSEAASGRTLGTAFEWEYTGRNTSSTSFFAVAWDGSAQRGIHLAEVPDGDYVIELSVLKALGDDSNPVHWERWTSPVLTIARD